MPDFWTSLILALGLLCVIEGGLYACAPKAMHRFLTLLSESQPDQLQRYGLVSFLLGVVIVGWMIS